MKIKQVDYHRNGVAGNGFSVVLFTEREGRKTRNMVGVVFAERGNVAVFNVDMLAAGNIAFGENSWRGDNYESKLRAAVDEAEKNAAALSDQVRRDEYRTTFKSEADRQAALATN